MRQPGQDPIVTCPACGQKNRLRVQRVNGEQDRPVCGRCHQALQMPPRQSGVRRQRPWPSILHSLKDGRVLQRAAFPDRWLAWLTLLYAILLALLSLSNLIGPDRWGFGSLNLYLPQWIWLFPGLALLPWYLLKARRWIGIPLLLLVWVAGPIMGLCWRWLPAARSEHGIHLRVMTYNVKWGYRDPQAILEQIRQDHPDLILMQDSAGAIDGPLRSLRQGWNIQVLDQYTILSHFPVSPPEARWISYPQQDHRVARCVVQVGSLPVVVYDAHLLSPRWGLVALKHPRSGGFADLQANVEVRLAESSRLSEQVRGETGWFLVAGDLNAPVQSLVCRQLLDRGLTDAFSAAGRGYGYSYGQATAVGFPFVRIDHILIGPAWQVQRCWAGGSKGSDHCPVIADLVLPVSEGS